MKQETLLDTPKPASGRTSREHQSGSFLIRVWSEGREADGQPSPVRVFLRNLKTGEERYLGDLDQLGETVLRQFEGIDRS